MKNKLTYIAFGIISAFGSFLLSKYIGDNFKDGALSFIGIAIPGFIFGLVLSVIFVKASIKDYYKILRLFIFALISGFAYFLAVITTIKVSSNQTDFNNFFIGGMLGGLVMLIGYHFLLKKIRINQLVFLVLFSGVLSLSLPLVMNNFKNSDEIAIFLLFLFWQTPMLYLLGYIKDLPEYKNN
jgi:hypothetical protein